MRHVLSMSLVVLLLGLSCQAPKDSEEGSAFDEDLLLADSDTCTFDLLEQTDEFLKGIKAFEGYVWDDASKTAHTEIEGGDSVFIHRGGCTQFGISAKWIMDDMIIPLDDKKAYLDFAYWLSKKFLPEEDKQLFRDMVKEKAYQDFGGKERLYLSFTGHNYSEWYLTVDPTEDPKVKVLETGYYFE